MQRKSWKYLFNSLVTVLAITMIVGCGKTGPERATISGNVTFNGQPVEKGTIEFIPTGETKGPASGGGIENGQYNISEKGPLPGQHAVKIKAIRKTGKKIDAEDETEKILVEETEQYIPPKYNSETTLEVSIVSGTNKQDFKLTDDPAQSK